MPGNGGMLPSASNRSVPVLMPLYSTSTSISPAPGSASCRGCTDRLLGLWKQRRLLAWMYIYIDILQCQ